MLAEVEPESWHECAAGIECLAARTGWPCKHSSHRDMQHPRLCVCQLLTNSVGGPRSNRIDLAESQQLRSAPVAGAS